MAYFSVSGMTELNEALDRMSEIPWDVKEKALNAMADVAASKVKAQGMAMGVRDPDSSVHILDTIKPVKAKEDDDGGHQDITFSGKRTRHGKQTRNAEIAFINEFGKTGQPARPFIGTGMARNDDAIADPGAKVIGDWIENEFQR